MSTVYNLADGPTLFKVQFKTTIQTPYREYLINYYPDRKEMKVIEQKRIIDENFPTEILESKEVFKVTYSAVILTPNNVEEKLPILLLLS